MTTWSHCHTMVTWLHGHREHGKRFKNNEVIIHIDLMANIWSFRMIKGVKYKLSVVSI